MRIALDVSILETPHRTGVERVQHNLIETLTRIDRGHEYLLVSKRPFELGFQLPENWRRIALIESGSPYLWRERLLAPLLDREKIDVFHSPVSAMPILGKAKKIVTLHELPWVERGARHEAFEPAPKSHRVWLFLNARYATRIVAGSQRPRDQVVKLYPSVEPRVRVIHHGVDPRFRTLSPAPERHRTLERLRIPDRPFLLFVGTLRRKKNLRGLLRAFAELPPTLRDAHSLVLVGVRSATFAEIESELADPRLVDRVFTPGWLNDEDLVALYNLAGCVVYPSLFEGFGLPPLEAMACGAPVVASSGGAIPEIVGDAAHTFDPEDPKALGAALHHVLSSKERARELVKRGHEHVKRFDWMVTAQRYLDLYREVVEG